MRIHGIMQVRLTWFRNMIQLDFLTEWIYTYKVRAIGYFGFARNLI